MSSKTKPGDAWAAQMVKLQVQGQRSKRKLEDTKQPPISAFFEPVAPPPKCTVVQVQPAPVQPAPVQLQSAPVQPVPVQLQPAPVQVSTPPTRPPPVLVVPTIERTCQSVALASLPWTEKHRPQTIVRVVGNMRAKETVQQWFAARQWRQPLLITGPNGIGKTSLAHAACRDYNFMVQECNALPGELMVLVQELLHRKGSEPVALILDEVNTYTSSERSELVKLFKRPLSMPVILVSDELDKSMEGLKGVCKVVRMYKQVSNLQDARTLTTSVLKAEAKGLYPAQLNMIHAAACGDLRRCMIMLELACKTRRCRAEEHQADVFVESLFDAASSVLYKQPRQLSLEQGVAMFKQHDLMKWMVHENYTEVSDMDVAVNLATSLSDVDVLDSHPSHHLHEHADVLAVASVMTWCGTPPPFAPRVNFPTALATFTRKKSFAATLHETRLSWHDWRMLNNNFSWLASATGLGAKDLSKLVKTHTLNDTV